MLQYQINLDPKRLREYGVGIRDVTGAVRAGNNDGGGGLVEIRGREYMVRGRGYSKNIADLENIVLAATPDGIPVRVRDVGQVTTGPETRRGLADLNGTGEVVSGIIVMRQKENALAVIERVRKKLKDLGLDYPTAFALSRFTTGRT